MSRPHRRAARWAPMVVVAVVVGAALVAGPSGAAHAEGAAGITGAAHAVGAAGITGAAHAEGAAVAAPVRVATTPAPDTVAPSQPGPIEIAEITAGSIRLTWAASTDNVGVVSYEVSQAFTDVIMLRSTPTNEIVYTGLSASRRYGFSVAAKDAAGNRSLPVSLTMVMPPGDDQPPTVPGTPWASGITDTTVTLSWSPSVDNVVLQTYEVLRITDAGSTVVATVWQQPPAFPNSTTTLRGLSPNTSYTFAVRARDEVGNVSAASGTVTVTTRGSGPEPPTRCTVTYRIAGQWSTGFQAEVTIRNEGPDTIDGWELSWSFPSGQNISYGWAGVFVDPTGPRVTVRNASWNGRLAPGASAWFGFIGTWQGTNTVPANFTLNGAVCGTASGAMAGSAAR